MSYEADANPALIATRKEFALTSFVAVAHRVQRAPMSLVALSRYYSSNIDCQSVFLTTHHSWVLKHLESLFGLSRATVRKAAASAIPYRSCAQRAAVIPVLQFARIATAQRFAARHLSPRRTTEAGNPVRRALLKTLGEAEISDWARDNRVARP